MESSTVAGLMPAVSLLTVTSATHGPQPIAATSMKGSDRRRAVRHRPSLSDSRGRSVGSRPSSSASQIIRSDISPCPAPPASVVVSRNRPARRGRRVFPCAARADRGSEAARINKTAAIRVHTAAGHREPCAPVVPLASHQRHQRDVRQIGSAHRHVRDRPQTEAQIADRKAGQRPAAPPAPATASRARPAPRRRRPVEHRQRQQSRRPRRAGQGHLLGRTQPVERPDRRPTAAATPPTARRRQPPATAGRSRSSAGR